MTTMKRLNDVMADGRMMMTYEREHRLRNAVPDSGRIPRIAVWYHGAGAGLSRIAGRLDSARSAVPRDRRRSDRLAAARGDHHRGRRQAVHAVRSARRPPDVRRLADAGAA